MPAKLGASYQARVRSSRVRPLQPGKPGVKYSQECLLEEYFRG
jgi:hypothetical protein